MRSVGNLYLMEQQRRDERAVKGKLAPKDPALLKRWLRRP